MKSQLLVSTFASAATLIFRHLGLEARYVVGFGAYSDGHSNTMVTAKNAHAWCEVYFNNVGWITVDPTGLDTGMIRSGTGDYGDGFGGSGITDFSKILYGGNIVVSYDYSKDSSFEEDTAVSANDPARWYLTYDGKDHHKADRLHGGRNKAEHGDHRDEVPVCPVIEIGGCIRAGGQKKSGTVRCFY